MNATNLDDRIRDIIKKDPRFTPEAYLFVMDTLNITKSQLNREGHLTGQELSYGVKSFGHYLFGLMAKRVFANWGIFKTDDIGDIVYNLIEAGMFGKSEEDDILDFHNVFDFKDELVDKYIFRFGE
jgi:uncharacterized repeat protein (TIGR04138 family)